jgi:hypothetical protein
MPGQAGLKFLSPRPSTACRVTRRTPVQAALLRQREPVTLSEGEIGELHVGLKGTMAHTRLSPRLKGSRDLPSYC